MSVEQETIRDAAAIVPSQEIIQVPVAALIEAIGHKVVSITGFEPGTSDDRFREKVERVQADMISKGRVCQLIVSRLFESKLLEGGPHDVFTRLLAIP